MEFINGASLDLLVQHGADIVAMGPGAAATQMPMREIFLDNGIPSIDFLPERPRKYVLPIPSEAIVSRNDTELSVGRYAVLVPHDTAVGQTIINAHKVAGHDPQ